MKPYLAQIRANLRLMGRDRTVLFFNYFFPLIFFIIFAVTFGGSKNPGSMSQVVNMVLVLGVLGSGFFGAGIRAVQDREANILRRFKVAPVGPAPIIVASLVSGLVSFFPSILLVLGLARFWLQLPLPAHLADFLIFVCVGSLAFRALGMIVAAIVNSPQESQILTQILYLPMLFLSGATFPIQFFPHWLQIGAQFVPATYLFQGMQSMMLAGGSLSSNIIASYWPRCITMVVAVFIGVKLFRWEKEAEDRRQRKAMGSRGTRSLSFCWASTRRKASRTSSRIKSLPVRCAAIRVSCSECTRFYRRRPFIPNGAVLVREGKLRRCFRMPPPMQARIKRHVIDAAGKTLLPGLIDMHVHLELPAAYIRTQRLRKPGAQDRELAAYLYSGVPRSAAPAIRSIRPAPPSNRSSGRELGAELFACGPMFTAEGGHGTEYARFLPRNDAKHV